MEVIIKNQELKFELSSKDLKKLLKKGILQTALSFGPKTGFLFEIKSKKNGNRKLLNCNLKNNKIQVVIARKDVKAWKNTKLLGYDAVMKVGKNKTLYVLLEKK